MSTVSKPVTLADNGGNDVVTVASEVKNTTSTVEEESSSVVLTNGKSNSNSSPPQVNGGVAPVRHEIGNNKNLTVEIDIPPGTCDVPHQSSFVVFLQFFFKQ